MSKLKVEFSTDQPIEAAQLNGRSMVSVIGNQGLAVNDETIIEGELSSLGVKPEGK